MTLSIRLLFLRAVLAGAVFLIPMTMPAASNVIDVTAFGAKAEAGFDNFDAVRAAIAACKGVDHPRMVFPAGTYYFSKDKLPTNRLVFDFKDVNDLTIDGQGATLIFAGKANAFAFLRCNNLTVRNLKIDWDRVPFSQGKVFATGDHSIDVQVDAAYPINGTEKVQGMMDYDPETHLPLANLDVFGSAIASVKLLGPQQLRITLKPRSVAEKEAHQNKYLAAMLNKLVVLRHEVYGSYGFDFGRCNNVTLENISVYACPGMAIHASLSSNISSDHVEVRIKPGSGRLMSTTADCQYYTFCSGTISVKNGFYENMGDDGFNATAKYRAITKVVDAKTIETALPTKGWQGPAPEKGEKLVFQNKGDLSRKATATVVSGKWDEAKKAFVVQFDAPVTGLAEGDLWYSETYLPKVSITDSTFQGMRSRAILLSTEAKVSKCTIRGSGYPGVLLKGGLRHGAEGPSPENIEISDCTFEGCGGAAIYGYSDGMDRAAGALSNIVIERNTIRDIPALAAQRFEGEHPTWMHWASAISLISTKGARITGNTIENYKTAIYLRRCADVVVDGNSLKPAGTALVDDASCTGIAFKENPGITREAASAEIRPDLEYVNDMR